MLETCGILETRPREYEVAQVMNWPSAFEMQLYFHAFIILEECVETRLVLTVGMYNSGTQLS